MKMVGFKSVEEIRNYSNSLVVQMDEFISCIDSKNSMFTIKIPEKIIKDFDIKESDCIRWELKNKDAHGVRNDRGIMIEILKSNDKKKYMPGFENIQKNQHYKKILDFLLKDDNIGKWFTTYALADKLDIRWKLLKIYLDELVENGYLTPKTKGKERTSEKYGLDKKRVWSHEWSLNIENTKKEESKQFIDTDNIWSQIKEFHEKNRTYSFRHFSDGPAFGIREVTDSYVRIVYSFDDIGKIIEKNRFLSAYLFLKERKDWTPIGSSFSSRNENTIDGRIKNDVDGPNKAGQSTALWVCPILVTIFDNIEWNGKKRGQALKMINKNEG